MSNQDFYNSFPGRLCEICNSHDSHLLFRQQFSHMSRGGLMTGYDVVVCSVCGFTFADHVPGQAVFDDYYKNMSKYEYRDSGGKESAYDLDRFREIFNLLRPFFPDRRARILDVGCSTGRLLSLFREDGFTNVLGLDPSAVCATSAKKLYNVRVLTKTIAEFDTQENEFGCIIFSGVLEHILDLGHTLSVLRRLLSDSGKIFIEVPDATRFSQHSDAPYQQFSIEHINFFSPVSLSNLMRRHGFKEIHFSQSARNQTPNTVMPVVSAVYEKNCEPVVNQIVKDTNTECDLMEYIRKSQEGEKRIHEVINKLVEDAVPIIIWGAGTHALHLLATSRLSEAPIRAFVDSNPRLQGAKLNGIQVIAPANLRGRSESILICSRGFQEAIEKQIRHDLGLPNKIIRLH